MPIGKLITARSILLSAVFLSVCVFSVVSENGSTSVVQSWISNSFSLVFISFAAAIIISSGHVDISTGAVMSFLGMTLIFLISLFGISNISVILAHLIAIISGLFIYWLMQKIIGSRVSSLIITLSIFFICKGLATFLQACLQGAGTICRQSEWVNFDNAVGLLPNSFVLSHLGDPLFSLIGIVILTVAILFMRFYTRRGLNHVAVGADKSSSRFAGISIDRVHRDAFLLAGFLVVCGTLVRLHGQTNGGWSANTGWGEELLGIAIAVIGGTRITGGRLDPVSVALAALVVYSMRDVVTNDLRLPAEMAAIVFGIVMASVAWFDARRVRGDDR